MDKLWRILTGYMHTTDKWLLGFWLTASAVSLLFLWGIYNSGMALSSKLISQVGAIGLGFVAATVISVMDYNRMIKLWKLYVPVCVVLSALTFTALGVSRGTNQAWLSVPLGGLSYTIQPLEFLKISFITTFALHLSKVGEHINSPLHVLLLCLHGGAHVIFIQQQDSGSALIFAVIFVVMFFCAGLNWKYIVGACALVACAIPLLWFNIMTEDQKMRILILNNPELDPDIAFQQLHSTIALGVGGVEGTGIFSGHHVYVPEIYNDFIFSFIGESSGFMGCIGVIILLLGISFKVLYNSGVAKDDTGRLICVGVFAMLISQIFVNLGMCLGILPVIGVTLPLISAGGTSVLSLYMSLGLVLSVYRFSNTALFYEK